jgi:hypothetical protein
MDLADVSSFGPTIATIAIWVVLTLLILRYGLYLIKHLRLPDGSRWIHTAIFAPLTLTAVLLLKDKLNASRPQKPRLSVTCEDGKRSVDSQQKLDEALADVKCASRGQGGVKSGEWFQANDPALLRALEKAVPPIREGQSRLDWSSEAQKQVGNNRLLVELRDSAFAGRGPFMRFGEEAYVGLPPANKPKQGEVYVTSSNWTTTVLQLTSRQRPSCSIVVRIRNAIKPLNVDRPLLQLNRDQFDYLFGPRYIPSKKIDGLLGSVDVLWVEPLPDGTPPSTIGGDKCR